MLLYQIIEKIENLEFVPYEDIARYKKSLYRYFDGQAYSRYNDLILVVYPWSNSCALATITTGSEYNEVIEKYIEDNNLAGDDAEYFKEVVGLSSQMMNKIVGDL